MLMDSVTPRERAVQKMRRAAMRTTHIEKRRVEHVIRAERSINKIADDLMRISLGTARLVEVKRPGRSKRRLVLVIERVEAKSL